MATRLFSSSVLTTSLLASFAGLWMLGCTPSATSTTPTPSSQTSPASPIQKSEPITTGTEPIKSDKPEDSKAVIASSDRSSNASSNTEKPVVSKPVQAKETPVEYQGEIISSVKADWNEDGLTDTALLVPSKTEDDRATLLIYFGTPNSNPQLEFEFNNLVWQGAMYGTKPALSVNPQGSLVIESGNDAIGRDRWNQKITAMYEKNLFVVAGFTYSYRDTLDLAAGGTCDVNFLTGRGVRNDKDFRVSAKSESLLDWKEESAPKECSF